jgi:hypothetical protein
MTREQAVEKFRRYTEPSLGRKRAQALVSFILDGNGTEPAQKCLSLEG